jgi:hypothetical protein
MMCVVVLAAVGLAACGPRVVGPEAEATDVGTGSSTVGPGETSSPGTTADEGTTGATDGPMRMTETGSGGNWTGECELHLERFQPPVTIDSDEWPTENGVLAVTTDCTMTTSVEAGAWVATLDCLDPDEEVQRALEIRALVPEGMVVDEVSERPVKLEITYGIPIFGTGAIVGGFRISADDRTIAAWLDIQGGSFTGWLESVPPVLPEVDVEPVELGCEPAPDNDERGYGTTWRALAFDFTSDAGEIRLLAREAGTLGPHLIHLFGAVQHCEPGDESTGCAQPQLLVLPAG